MSTRRILELVGAILIAAVIWLGFTFWKAERTIKFMSAFTSLQYSKTPLSIAQVENMLGQPVRIEHAESAGVIADAYHYPTYPPGGDLKIVFINGVVSHTELPPYKTL